MFECYNILLLNDILKWQFIVCQKQYTGCEKKFYCIIDTIKCCNKTIHDVWNKKNICLCLINLLYQWYNILLFDHLSIRVEGMAPCVEVVIS